MSSGSKFNAALAALIVVIAGLGLMNARFAKSQREVTFIRVPADDIASSEAQPARGGANALRVCADPNNMPFSNRLGEGFENRLAELIATDLGREVSYTWWPQRRGFVRNTLRAHNCDLVMGVPAQLDILQTTTPYYRSTYVFVTRAADALALESLDDPRLRRLRIGVHAIGDDYSNVPPAQALADRGIVDNVRGYSIYGDYSQPDPTRALIDAVAEGEVDVAIAWGPLAGYFAQQADEPLEVSILANPQSESGSTTFEIAMGVRQGEEQFKAQIERVMAARSRQIEDLLRSYAVPLLPRQQPLAQLAPEGD